MSLHFSQVLGSSTSSEPIQEVKLGISDLQRKRALARTRTPMYTTYLSSLYNSRPLSLSNNNPQLMKAESKDLNHLPLSTTAPVPLASQCINSQIEKDNSTPILYEILSKYAVDNYNFQPNEPLGPFSKFEKSSIYNVPDRLLQQCNDSNCITNMGILPDLKRAWVTIDEKLFIWNYNASVMDQEFDTVDDFNGTILTVALVKPKPNVFVSTVNYLLLIATSKEIRILALEYSAKNLAISDTKMSVSVQGLLVNKFVTFNKTHDIFFTGTGSGDAIWKLNYSNTNEWFKKSCSKECLSKSSLSTVVPTISNIPVLNWLSGDGSSNSSMETVQELTIDQDRNILYTLSSRSIIKAYKLQNHQGKVTLGSSVTKRTSDLLKELSTTPINVQSPLLSRSKLKIINIFSVRKIENNNLFLVAISQNGCRFYINGSTLYGDRLTLTTTHVKFPPLDLKAFEEIEKRKEKLLNQDMEFLNSSIIPNAQPTTTINLLNNTTSHNNNINNNTVNSKYGQQQHQLQSKSITKNPAPPIFTVQELRQAQENSQLLSNLQTSLIISPGIFIGCSSERGLFSSTPDYGVLKKSSQYIEDFEIIETLSNVNSIVQLTPSFNATDTPKGYSNEFATQYNKDPLEFAVLTNTGIHIYRYRTPDLILEDSLDDSTFNQFSMKYGSDEACSTSLYLACKYGKSESFRNLATKFFISGGQNSKLNKNLPPIIDNVELSDKFFAVLILISRLIRLYWDKEVFKLKNEIKFNRQGYIDINSIKRLKDDKKIILEGLNISKVDLEYLLCSILIIIKFFEDNKKIIPGLSQGPNNQNESTSWKEKESEVCIQAEQIGFDALSKFLNTMKEGLSFLAILLEDSNDNEKSSKENSSKDNKNFSEIMGYISVQLQADLSCLKFSDFFTKSDPSVSKLVKELLSSIINKSIAAGNSVELVANTLQEKCGSFCSTGDVLIFKAIESLKNAKGFADNKDNEMKMKQLQNAIKLLKQTSDSLTEETITDCVNIILQMEYYDGAVQFILDVANTPEQTKLALQYETESQTTKSLDPITRNAYDRRLKLYNMIFQILVDIDKRAISSVEKAANTTLIGSNENSSSTKLFNNFGSSSPAFVDSNGQLVTQYSQMRDLCYKICLNYKDKKFHYEFYKWFIENGIGEKLLYIDTPYILEFLKDYATRDLEMAKLLWIYYSKRNYYYEAASVLYDLAISQFNVELSDRIEFLSIANNFCQSIASQYLKQNIVILASRISDLISVSNLQDELLLTILQDERVGELAKQTTKQALNGQILTINDLYNDYIDPLGYYELALISFKISDHRNPEDILSKWEALFEKWFYQYSQKSDSTNEPFYVELTNKFVLIAERLNDIDALFPMMDLLSLMFKYVYGPETSDKAESGVIVDSFTKSNVSFGKLYYNLKNLIESTTFELFKGYSKSLKQEMCYLIHDWYKNDKKLREVISSDVIVSMKDYSVDNDPIYQYIKTTGNPL